MRFDIEGTKNIAFEVFYALFLTELNSSLHFGLPRSIVATTRLMVIAVEDGGAIHCGLWVS